MRKHSFHLTSFLMCHLCWQSFCPHFLHCMDSEVWCSVHFLALMPLQNLQFYKAPGLSWVHGYSQESLVSHFCGFFFFLRVGSPTAIPPCSLSFLQLLIFGWFMSLRWDICGCQRRHCYLLGFTHYCVSQSLDHYGGTLLPRFLLDWGIGPVLYQ